MGAVDYTPYILANAKVTIKAPLVKTLVECQLAIFQRLNLFFKRKL